MIYHLVVGDEAATPLRAAFQTTLSSEQEIVVLRDLLNVGPLLKGEEGQKFSAMRSQFWQSVLPPSKETLVVDDLERLLLISNELYKEEKHTVYFWMAPTAPDIVTYYWLLFFLKNHRERFYVVNVSGLPFIDEQGKLFYPKNISEIPSKELIKARKLARIITPSEMEVDLDEWEKLKTENTAIRTHEGGKKIVSQQEGFYDSVLLSFCSNQFQKASKIIRQTLSKYALPTGDLYLGYRFKQLALLGQVTLQGDPSKALNEWEIKLAEVAATINNEVAINQID